MITTYEYPQNARKTFYSDEIPQYDAYRIKGNKMRMAKNISESSINRINHILSTMTRMTSDSGPSWYRTIFVKREEKRYHVYCVLDGLNGCYMPNTVAYFTNKKAALSYAVQLERES